MNTWAKRRKRIIFLIVFSFLAFIVALPAFLLFYEKPTCFDGKHNGRETGVDCGGSCALLCQAESLPLILRGDPQILPVKDNIFNAVAVFDNPNVTGEIYRASYTLKIYGSLNNIPIKTIEGEVHVPKSSTFAIFEGPFTIDAGATPSRATIEWKGDFSWGNNLDPIPALAVSGQSFSRLENSPRLTAEIINNSQGDFSHIDLVALISDETGNIFAASKTLIDLLPAGESRSAVFSWPTPFERNIVDTEILIRVLPDRSFIR